MNPRPVAELACDLVWLTGLANEVFDDLKGRTIRVWRHRERPACWIDGGADRSWIADLTPTSSSIVRARPDAGAGWRQWGGKRTDGARISRASSLGGDRVLVFGLPWRSRVGDEEQTDLVLELGGRQTNAVLVAPDGRILDVLRPVSRRVNRVRELLPGRAYQPPPTSSKQRIDQQWDWERFEEGPLGEVLRRRFLAASTRWATEVCFRCNLATTTPLRVLGESERSLLEQAGAELLREPVPYLILDDGEKPIDHTGFRPSHLPGGQFRKVATFALAAQAVQDERRSRAAEGQHAADRAEHHVRERRRLERALGNLREDLDRAGKASELSRRADIIMGNLATIPDGSAEATLVDWSDSDGKAIAVPLDPAMPASDYAERLYRRARKLRQSIPHLTKRVTETERALLRLEQDDPDRSAGPPERTPLRRVAAVSTRRSETRRSSDPRHQIHPRRYRTRDGAWLVLAGRDDRENDILSLKVAAPEDYWFHAHGSSGSHVVLRREGRKDTPSRRAIAEAAGVAAYWSKQRGASNVGVSYTLAKHVTKPRGSKPGTVAIRREKLLVVPPALPPLADEPSTGERGVG